MDSSLITAFAAFALGGVAVARATRLITSDAYPPMVWVRERWLTWTAQTERREAWAPLLTCPFCATPYLAAADLTWVLWSGAYGPAMGPGLDVSWAGAWWVVNTWAAVSYLAAMIVVRDEPPAED